LQNFLFTALLFKLIFLNIRDQYEDVLFLKPFIATYVMKQVVISRNVFPSYVGHNVMSFLL